MTTDPIAAGGGQDQGLAALYDWVRRTRAGVFRYLEGVPLEMALARDPAFRGSMLGLMMHVADCYLYWIEQAGVGRGRDSVDAGEPAGLGEVRERFVLVDRAVAGVLARPVEQLDAPMEYFGERYTWRWLLLHPVTHEFHHKGQVAALGRILGHPVPEGTDLDLVLPG